MGRESYPFSQSVQLTLTFPLAKSLEKSLHQTTTLWAFMRSGVNHSYSYTGHPVAPTLCIVALQEFLAKSCLKRNRLDSDNLGLGLWMLIEEPRAWL